MTSDKENYEQFELKFKAAIETVTEAACALIELRILVVENGGEVHPDVGHLANKLYKQVEMLNKYTAKSNY